MEVEEEAGKELLDECWEMIFNRLKHESDQESITLVCKRFLSISNSLRVSINFSGYTPITVLCWLLKRFSNLKKIQVCNFEGDMDEAVLAIARSGLDLEELVALSYCRSHPKVWLEELGSNMKNLKVLKFTGGEGDADFVRVADAFPQLEELFIKDEAPYIIYVTDKGMDYISSKLKRLRKIDLSNKSRISDKSLISLSKNCPLLEQIEIHDCNSVTQEGISFLVNNSHHLNSSYICKHLKIDSFGVEGSTNILTNLRSLKLQYVDILDEFLFSIIEARIHLTDLALTDCKSYTFTGISRLLQHSSQSLKSLELGRVEFLTNEHVEYLSSFLQNLTSITLFNCSKLSDSAFVMITQRCPRLCYFVMTGSSFVRDEYNYDGLIKKNRAIKYLDLSSHHEFRPTALKRLLNICPEVEKLKIHGCYLLPNDQLNVPDILECNRSLVELNFIGSHHITVKDRELELESSVLEKLIVKFSLINDIFLTKLGRICPRLIHLDLSYCSKVTEDGVMEVVKSCKRLRYLSLSRCEKVDINIIPWIVANGPSLRELVSSSRNYPDDKNQKLFLQQGCLVLKDPNYPLNNEDEFMCNML
ncbi:F-box/LRR-repeat protein 20-like [Chenopodium quinoa]|uniref:F-box/LRR-repeat protein 20-like n=1 Tax=Chenopodium quinoa TaxID=63459 RepID=UPI000B779152|nr:F-box/LRR-repeat protein 20-like [Chenopodium quinoa]